MQRQRLDKCPIQGLLNCKRPSSIVPKGVIVARVRMTIR